MRGRVGMAVVLMLGAFAAAACEDARLLRLQGEVRSQDGALLKKGDAVCQGAELVTAKSARAELRFRDGTLVTVGGASRFRIDRYAPEQAAPELLLTLGQGAFRAVTGAISKVPNKRIEVRTPVATIGVRGTTFWGGFGLSDGGALDVVVLEGTGVVVQNEQGEVLLDRQGLGTTVVPGQAPALPKSWPGGKLGRAQATIQFTN